MANFTIAASTTVTKTAADTFIPELWSDETLSSHKSNIVMAGLVRILNHQGKKGDVIHVPKPTRGAASTKSAASQVTLIANTESEETITINTHQEYSRLIEDIVDVQALDSLRAFYVDDAGYALAKAVDTTLHNLAATWGGATNYVGSGNNGAVIGSDGSTAWAPAGNGNGAALSDAGIRRLVQTFDDLDVPMADRVMVIPPVEKRNLLGVARFTEQAFTGEAGSANSIRNGLIGELYAVPFYVSSNCATVTDNGGSTSFRVALFFHKGSLVLAEQLNIRTQSQYKQEFLADLFTADILYGARTIQGRIAGEAGRGAKAVVVPA